MEKKCAVKKIVLDERMGKQNILNCNYYFFVQGNTHTTVTIYTKINKKKKLCSPRGQIVRYLLPLMSVMITNIKI